MEIDLEHKQPQDLFRQPSELALDQQQSKNYPISAYPYSNILMNDEQRKLANGFQQNGNVDHKQHSESVINYNAMDLDEDQMDTHSRKLSIHDLCNDSQQPPLQNSPDDNSPPEQLHLFFKSREEEAAQLLSEMRDGSLSVPTSPAPPPTPIFDQSSSSSANSSASANFVYSNFYQSDNDNFASDQLEQSSYKFISRVSQLPVVNSTIKTIGDYYQSGKNNSKVLKYSAETVEYSVKSIIDSTKPMLSRFEPSIGQLDNFACKQLDKFEKTFSPDSAQSAIDHGQQQAQSIFQWNQYLSAESARSLQFCMEWLVFATKHIDNQINLLRNGMSEYISKLQNNEGTASIIQNMLSLVNAVKREVVETMKKVVDIIGKYAGSALPIEAKNLVRGFILSLPSRWNLINNAAAAQDVSVNGNGATEIEAQRVLSLAEETKSIINNTMSVFTNLVQLEKKPKPQQ